jgi:hypothetical protein
VFLLLVANDQDVSTDPLDIAEFIHVCWARCHSSHAALHGAAADEPKRVPIDLW